MNERKYRTPEEMRQRKRARQKRKRRRQVCTTVAILGAFLLGIIVGRKSNDLNLENVVPTVEDETLSDNTVEQEEEETITTKLTTGMQTGLTEEEIANFVVAAPEKMELDQALVTLSEREQEDTRYTTILFNQSEYPEALLIDLANNPEMISFVEDYPGDDLEIDTTVTSEELAEKCPLFLQWDKRWGYQSYGDDSTIAVSGCGPTALAMVVSALTGDATVTPATVANFAMNNDYYMYGTGTMWSLMTEGAAYYGITSVEIDPEEETMKQSLEDENILICSMGAGDFTTAGHFIVIYDVDEEGFWVNDPFCIYRSEQKWTFKQLEDQIKSIWALRY